MRLAFLAFALQAVSIGGKFCFGAGQGFACGRLSEGSEAGLAPHVFWGSPLAVRVGLVRGDGRGERLWNGDCRGLGAAGAFGGSGGGLVSGLVAAQILPRRPSSRDEGLLGESLGASRKLPAGCDPGLRLRSAGSLGPLLGPDALRRRGGWIPGIPPPHAGFGRGGPSRVGSEKLRRRLTLAPGRSLASFFLKEASEWTALV